MVQFVFSWMGMAFLIIGLRPAFADAEWMLSLYGGIAHTLDSDVKLKAPESARLTFHDVSWEDQSFEEPQYFGLRLTYWLDRQSPWGLAVDFAHAKMIADLDQEVTVTGSRGDDSVNDGEVLGDSFLQLAFSHGHNVLTANVLYRWLSHNRFSWSGRLQPYVGLGAGVAIPHVEVRAGPFESHDYQFTGPTVQGLAGLSINLMKHIALFAETRLNYAHIDVDLHDGSSLETNPWTYHFNIGLSLST
jgi:lipid A oxidase